MEPYTLLVFFLALAGSRFVNWAIYTWAWNARALGPWAPPPVVGKRKGERRENRKGKSKGKGKNGPQTEFPPRTWVDHLPILGWYRLRAESAVHGRGYWIRPLCIELFLPILLAWYFHVSISGIHLPPAFRTPANLALTSEIWWRFAGHFVLLHLLTIATFIDFDEHTIPDFVTVPGTIIGLLGAAFAVAWLPPELAGPKMIELRHNLPGPWPTWMNGPWGLGLAITILLVWCFALLDRRWITRRGLGKAIQYFFARAFRVPLLWGSIFAVTAGLIGLTVYSYYCLPGGRWTYLLSSLIGLAVAGGITWGLRISASTGLGVEALGFGDVTLMAMIGTYIGWQPSLLVFFISPMIAILFVLIRAILTGNTMTPYGPYLCAGTVVVLVGWESLWFGWASRFLILGNTLLGIVIACIALMGVLLFIWRLIKQALGLGGY
ncbi:MAG: prepilin peptidase [Aureliella sp.]